MSAGLILVSKGYLVLRQRCDDAGDDVGVLIVIAASASRSSARRVLVEPAGNCPTPRIFVGGS